MEGGRILFYPFNYNYQNYSGNFRQQSVSGQATWTNGGNVTQCNIPWSSEQYMTTAVSSNSPYQCGQKIRVINPETSREITVTVVDTVPNAPATSLNLHRQAFAALGADPSVGIIPIQFQLITDQQSGDWDDFLLRIMQAAYPGYQVVNYSLNEKTAIADNQVKEVYDFTLRGAQGSLSIRGTVIYNPSANRVISFHAEEI